MRTEVQETLEDDLYPVDDQSYIKEAITTVNAEIFARILFSRMALKDVFATFKIRD